MGLKTLRAINGINSTVHENAYLVVGPSGTGSP